VDTQPALRGAPLQPAREWLEADGLGGFASGCDDLSRTRRYHALLLTATTPPLGRFALVQAVEAWLVAGAERIPLSAHRYQGDVVYPGGSGRIRAFRAVPWPRWTLDGGPAGAVEFELTVPRGHHAVCLTWRLSESRPGLRLEVRPLLSGRDPHALSRETDTPPFETEAWPGGVRWRPRGPLPAVQALANGAYREAPDWFRRFLYTEERERGYDHQEDLYSPGVFEFDLGRSEAALVFHADPELSARAADLAGAAGLAGAWRRTELARRGAFPSRLERAADAYLVRRGDGATIVAGYPWFGDWGRDTFIALRGLCLATGRLDEAGSILREWSRHVSDGMLPNRFPDDGREPEYNSVDAALWFVVAAHELLEESERAGARVDPETDVALRSAVSSILEGHARGTRHGIGVDEDGLLKAGAPGLQLTWMDARVEGRVITPRIGKPVEVQALWINALAIGARLDARWRGPFTRALRSFLCRFWSDDTRALHDVVDVDHARGTQDSTLRPNQVLAVGGLPLQLLRGVRARLVVDALERHLWTPLGLRSLERRSPDYRGTYAGDPVRRDEAYHQGTVWPWLIGPFVEAWVRVRGNSRAARAEARERFLHPLLAHLDEAGLGHVSEVADGDAPHRPGGCPFQAWSLGELVRLDRRVLGADAASAPEPSGQGAEVTA